MLARRRASSRPRAGFDANVQVMNLTSGRGPASGRSLNGLATLGVRQGHEILVSAHGPQAAAALDALAALAERDFDEQAAPAAPRYAGRPPAAPPDAGQALTGLARSAGDRLRTGAPLPPAGSRDSDRLVGDPEAEWEALTGALEQVRDRDRARRGTRSRRRAGDYSAAIFDAHLLFLDDEAPARAAHGTRSSSERQERRRGMA